MSGEYETGKWYGWNGGECPVHPQDEVDFIHPMNDVRMQRFHSIAAGRLCWKMPGAFRIIKPHVDLIEGYMLSCEPLHATREMAEAWLAELKRKNPGMFATSKIVHMKEVRE